MIELVSTSYVLVIYANYPSYPHTPIEIVSTSYLLVIHANYPSYPYPLQFEQLGLKDSLDYDLYIELFIQEKERIINKINNLEFNIRYSTIRINYYNEICSITTTIG